MFSRILSCLAVAALLCGCQRIRDSDRTAAIDCVRANLAAIENGNLEAAMATIHPLSPAFEDARRQTEAIFLQYRLKMELESAKIGQVSADSIEVNFIQVTRKIEGPDEFVDNRVEGTHVLKRDGTAWKIWSTRWNMPRTLDGQPLRAP